MLGMSVQGTAQKVLVQGLVGARVLGSWYKGLVQGFGVVTRVRQLLQGFGARVWCWYKGLVLVRGLEHIVLRFVTYLCFSLFTKAIDSFLLTSYIHFDVSTLTQPPPILTPSRYMFHPFVATFYLDTLRTLPLSLTSVNIGRYPYLLRTQDW
jgi:hypothetical protein